MNPRKFQLLWLAAFLSLGLPAGPAAAELIEIQFTGMDVFYDGGNIFDAKSANTVRDTSSDEADPLVSVQFFEDGSLVGTKLSNVYADLYVKGVSGIPVGGGSVVSSGNGDAFGFDLFSTGPGDEWKIELNAATFDIFYSGGEISIAVIGVASSVGDQDLPFGLPDLSDAKPISMVVTSSSLDDVTDDGTDLTGFRASGTGGFGGTAVPEPSSVVLAILAGLGIAVGWSRRRKSQ